MKTPFALSPTEEVSDEMDGPLFSEPQPSSLNWSQRTNQSWILDEKSQTLAIHAFSNQNHPNRLRETVLPEPLL